MKSGSMPLRVSSVAGDQRGKCVLLIRQAQ